MSNKAKLHTVAVLVGAFILLSTLGLMTLIQDKHELQQSIKDLKINNSHLQEVNTSLGEEYSSIRDELWSNKDSMEKMNAELDTLKKSIEDSNIQNKKLQSDNKKLQDANTGLKNSIKKLQDDNSYLKNQVSARKSTKTSVVAKMPSRGKTPSGTEIYMSATAYTAYCNGCSGVTRTGIDLRANPSLKVIAVDPSVIPLGTKVYVEGYGYAVAGDTGGAIKGHKIDLFMPDKSQALRWGRKQVKVTILK